MHSFHDLKFEMFKSSAKASQESKINEKSYFVYTFTHTSMYKWICVYIIYLYAFLQVLAANAADWMILEFKAFDLTFCGDLQWKHVMRHNICVHMQHTRIQRCLAICCDEEWVFSLNRRGDSWALSPAFVCCHNCSRFMVSLSDC